MQVLCKLGLLEEQNLGIAPLSSSAFKHESPEHEALHVSPKALNATQV